MKWFKHDSCASMDAKLQEVLLDYGLEGYGLYWYCLELISANVDHSNLTFELEHDARIIARNTGNTVQRVEEMMRRFIELQLFESSQGVITCIKLGKRCDEYTSKLLRNSGQNPDTLRTKSLLIEKKRIEENRKENNKAAIAARFCEFWKAYPNKKAKGQAEKAFIKIKPDDELLAKMIKAISSQKQAEKAAKEKGEFWPEWKHPSTWLNGKCWEDELKQTGNTQPISAFAGAI